MKNIAGNRNEMDYIVQEFIEFWSEKWFGLEVSTFSLDDDPQKCRSIKDITHTADLFGD